MGPQRLTIDWTACESLPRRVFSDADLRDIYREAEASLGIPPILLMEHAAIGAARVAEAMLREHPGPVLVVCGRGNNAGDGLAVARLLHVAGTQVAVRVLGGSGGLRTDVATHANIADRLALLAPDPDEPALVIDALFGTGLARPIEGEAAELVEKIAAHRAAGARVLALDLPSGMHADTGACDGPHVAADITVTFAGLKRGFEEADPDVLGQIAVAPIGVPPSLLLGRGEPA
ncbi:MAG: NAD(P)H-hydrate epimerase [Planctomycetota bacterium]